METCKPSLPSADDSNFSMIDVGAKAVTARRAFAQGRIQLSPAAYAALKSGTNPKGNVLALAEVAGIMAAKKTSDLLPLCHPLPIEKVRIRHELTDSDHSVWVHSEVSTSAKTGVEMEALSAVNGALLCIYDLSKAVDPVITISDIRLNRKEGGKSGLWTHPDSETGPSRAQPTIDLSGIRVSVLTISDRVSRGEATDRSGSAIAEFLGAAGATLNPPRVIADERDLIAGAFRRAALEEGAQLVISTGGTGFSPRDVTPEAVRLVCDREVPGFGELLRSEGARHTSMSWLSRSTAGLLGKSLIIALPGSEKAVREGLAALTPILPHALKIAAGGNHG